MPVDDWITSLYRVFEPYQLGDDFCVTSFAVSHQDYHTLASKPLRKLTTDDLSDYVLQAITTWGNVGHFKHFLPRLFELAQADILALDRPEVFFSKLELARWPAWPEPERAAVEVALMRLWEKQLVTAGPPHGDPRIITLLHGLHCASGSLKPFLKRWTEIDNRRAALHLRQTFNWWTRLRQHTGPRRSWPGLTDEASEELTDWLETKAVDSYLKRFGELANRYDHGSEVGQNASSTPSVAPWNNALP